MKPLYTIERWPHGWLLCGKGGIPATAVGESMKLFPNASVIDCGISHHFRACGNLNVAMCIVTPAHAKLWRDEISASIANLPPEERWWKGLDVGASAAAIFAVFCHANFRFAAHELGQESVPRDAADFGRCKRLMAEFPEWRPQLARVATAYSTTKWRAIVAHWAELEKATDTEVNQVLSNL